MVLLVRVSVCSREVENAPVLQTIPHRLESCIYSVCLQTQNSTKPRTSLNRHAVLREKLIKEI